MRHNYCTSHLFKKKIYFRSPIIIATPKLRLKKSNIFNVDLFKKGNLNYNFYI